MNTTNIAFPDRPPTYRVREERSEYDIEADTANHARQLIADESQSEVLPTEVERQCLVDERPTVPRIVSAGFF